MNTKLQSNRISRLAAVVILLASVVMATAQDVNGPRRSNYDGIPWFELPQGGFYMDDSPALNDFDPVIDPYWYVVPAFSSVRFKNLIPEQPYSWSYSDSYDMSDTYGVNVEDNGDFTIECIGPFDDARYEYTGEIPVPLPMITDSSIPDPDGLGLDIFGGWTLGWFGSNGSVRPLSLAPSKKCIPVGSGMLSTGYALGTGDGSDGFVQVVTKPASTLYVENISAKVVSKTQPLANGATLTMELCHVGQDDVVGTPFITLKATAADQSAEGQDGDMNVYNLVFRTADGQPFVINERFAVKVTGCSEPGVDVGFQVQEKRGEYVCPAVKSLSTSGDAAALDGFSNDMVAYLCFHGVFDKVNVSAFDFSTLTTTETLKIMPYSTSQMIYLQTAGWYSFFWDENGRPEGEKRYHPISTPDWINYIQPDYSIAEWTPELYEVSSPWGTIVLDFNFAPLPDGITGRYWKFYFTGLGVISNPLTIIQGDVTVPDAGDVNYDAVVDVEDVNALINLILNEGKLMDNPDADVNHDGNIDIADVNALINIILAQ